MRVAHTVEDLDPGSHQALLIDWDGTLADTQQGNFETLAGALGEVGPSIEYDWFAAHTGISTADIVAIMARHAGRRDVDADAVAQDRDARFRQS